MRIKFPFIKIGWHLTSDVSPSAMRSDWLCVVISTTVLLSHLAHRIQLFFFVYLFIITNHNVAPDRPQSNTEIKRNRRRRKKTCDAYQKCLCDVGHRREREKKILIYSNVNIVEKKKPNKKNIQINKREQTYHRNAFDFLYDLTNKKKKRITFRSLVRFFFVY